MNLVKEKLYLQQAFLSEVELFYSTLIQDGRILIVDEEYHHLKDVMRHKINDEIYITEGQGKIYKTVITDISKRSISCQIKSSIEQPNILKNITFCIPRLRSAERFEFAIEKCVELGITNIVVFDSNRSVAKGDKSQRWQKIGAAAMKQSLRAWLPNVKYAKGVNELLALEGNKLLFDQNADVTISDFISKELSTLHSSFFVLIFGPEGGFDIEEFKALNEEKKIKLTSNRLRSETAIITAASIIATKQVL